VIGVVGDVHQRDIETPGVAEMYFSYGQNLASVAGYFMPRDLAIRVSGDPLSYSNAVERAIWSVAPEQAISSVQSMQHLVNTRLQTYNLEAKLFAFFGGISLLLSALGIYGLMSYSVSLRTQEIGLRMALGAQRPQVLREFLVKALRLFLIGLGLGIPCSMAVARLLAGLLYGVSGIAGGAAVAPLLLLATAAAVAAYIPARRASAIDPMKALRAE
jgi:putative ABC transport system permease protein